MIHRVLFFPLALLALLFALLNGSAEAQCILANPSFELGAAGSQVFGGWNQFGSVGEIGDADHGAKAARLSGPNLGGWDVSAFWQSQDCLPGESWQATGRVRHPSGRPLVGQNVALVNIEWRDASGILIDYDSFSVADSGSPADSWLDFEVSSNPAPVGTASTRILLGVLQSPTDPSSDVHYDDVTFYSQSVPTIDQVQWNDFPAGTTVEFSGYTWRVKGPGVYGPGVNRFCNTADCVWVDAQDRLFLTLQNIGGNWYSTEVVLEDALGYGDYVLTTEGRLDLIDPQAVLGLFLWQYGPCWDYSYLWWNAFNEIDIEYSRWGDPFRDLTQFVAQPFDYPGNIERFDVTFSSNEIVSHAMRWLKDRVEYRVWRGGPDDESPSTLVHSWTYTGPHIPRPDQPRLHLNLWKLDGTPANDQGVMFTGFRFVPEGGATAAAPASTPRLASGRLYPASPNPFNPSTTIRFELDRAARTELDVYDLAGRHVRTLVRDARTAGPHSVTWDGRDDAGRVVASGVYLVRLQGPDFVDSQRVALIK